MIEETASDTLEQVLVCIGAVVVGERDHVGSEMRQGDVASARQPSWRAETEDVEVVGGDDVGDAIVVVLVDDEDTETAMRLAVERGEKTVELRRPVDGRHDQVEGRELRRGHRP